MDVIVNYYNKIQDSANITKVFLAISAACFTGILAQVRIPLPWTPVPITGEVFGVIIAGLILGKRYGALSQILFISLGIAGIPWFSGIKSGIGVILGANGGYLIGFILLSYFIHDLSKIFKPIGTIIGYFACIYIPGLIGLIIYHFDHGVLLSIPQLLMAGFIPFIIGDIIKIIAASSIAKLIEI